MNFFSVLVPVFNQVGKMDRCIASLKNQEFDDYEVIFVDDGSTDASYEMLEEFAASDDRYRIVRHEKNASLAAARFTGMKEATGEVIIFLDSDDYLSDDALKVLHDNFESSDADIIRFGFVYEPEGRVELPPEVSDYLQAVSDAEIAPAVWKNAYRKRVTDELLKHNEPFYCNMGEDVYFSHILFTFGKKIDRIDNVLYHYQVDTGMSAAGNKPEFSPEKFGKALREVSSVTDHILDFIREFNPEHEKQAKINTDRMQHVVAVQHLPFSPDNRILVDYVMAIKEAGLDDLYDYACNTLLKMKILAEEGVEMKDFTI